MTIALPANELLEPVLEVQDLGKEYRLYESPRARLKSLLTGRAYHRSHWALRGVSFRLARGQCMGVIGDNGAGKSSLLKLMAGTLQPSEGSVVRRGRVTAILELGAGFHPDFSGRDNLYFGGSLIGISATQMKALEHDIIAFSELGDAIDRPVKTYSSGMVVRLAFALVTAVEPDVLIIDEALAVGDQHFQKKCVDRIEAFRKSGCTILFCSHSLYHVRHLCDVALWLHQGEVRAYGDTESVLASYGVHVRAQDAPEAPNTAAPVPPLDGEKAIPGAAPVLGSSGSPMDEAALMAGKRAALVRVDVDGLERGEDGPARLILKDLVVHVTVRMSTDEQPSIAVMLEQSHGVGVTAVATHVDKAMPRNIGPGLWQATVTFPALPLHSSDYVVSAYLFDERGLVVYEEWLRCVEFRWMAPSLLPGLVHLPHHWS